MRDFIEKMREHGLVIDVEEPVSADMQAPKMAASTDKLLFFHKIEGARAGDIEIGRASCRERV